MKGNLKKIFSNQKKKIIFSAFLIFLIFFGLVFPLGPLYADDGILKKILAGIFPPAGFFMFGGKVLDLTTKTLVAALLSIPLVLGNALFSIATLLLGWVTSTDFISLPYTDPDINPVIGVGWPLIRDFANIFIILALVVIGLATALRIEEYRAQKTLPKLILVALLVNFSLVICGLVIDASNLVMNDFLKGLKGWEAFGNIWQKAGDMFTVDKIFENMKASTYIGELLALVLYAWIGGLIMFIYTLVFLTRYVALWILVVLSPLAFACYILPATKKYFSLWWNQFLQWSFIGVAAAFFLYLSNRLYFEISRAKEVFGIKKEIITKIGEGGTFNEIFPYFVVIAFLFLGVLVGFATSAYGASAVVGLARRGWKSAGRYVGARAWRGIKTWAEEKAKIREKAGAVTKGWERVPVGRWFLPEKLRKYAEFRPAAERAAEEARPFSSREIAYRQAIGADYGVKAVGGMLQLIERGDMQDLINAYKEKYYGKDWKEKKITDAQLFDRDDFKKEMGRRLEIAQRGGLHNQIIRSDPRLARIATVTNIPQYKGKSPEEAVGIAVSEARAPHIQNWGREVLEDLDVVEAGMREGQEYWENIRRHVKRGQETSHRSIDILFSNFVDEKKKEGISYKTDKEAWGKFREAFKKKHDGREGYFIYLESEHARRNGWREGRKLPLDKRITITEEERRKPPTPGEVMGVEKEIKALEEKERRKMGKVDREIRELKERERKEKERIEREAAGWEKPPTPGAIPEPRVPEPRVPEPRVPEPRVPEPRVKVPVMITRRMRADLKKKGYSDAEIDKMKPEKAAKILGLI